jgi:hypothetical protein
MGSEQFFWNISMESLIEFENVLIFEKESTLDKKQNTLENL